MKMLYVLTQAEMIKIVKSKIFIISLVGILFLPLVVAMFAYISLHPEFARESGIIAQKAKIISINDWSTFLATLSQMMSIAGIIFFGFLTSWVFGREYSDGTVKDLYALPVSRNKIVMAKYIAVSVWCFFLAALMFLVASGFGACIEIPKFSSAVYLMGLKLYAIITLLVTLLGSPIGFFGCVGKGYLSPLGFLVFVLLLGNILSQMGHGEYFPWSIPGIYSGAAGPVTLSPISFMLVVLMGALGVIATLLWWRFADQK